MCTLALAWQTFDGVPVAAVANRDERFDRPADPPTITRPDPADGAPTFVAPRDARAGGTWVGLNERGVYVTITNRWLETDLDGDRSRGLLVDECLRRSSAETAVRHIEREVRGHAYAGFNLVVADDNAAFLLSYDGRLAVTQLEPGLHVVVNVGGVVNGSGRFEIPDSRVDVGARQRETARRLFDRLLPEPGEIADDWLARASEALGDHDVGVCLHGDGFGTRSSSVVRTGRRPLFRFADGPPCRTPFEDVSLPPDWGDRDGRTEGGTDDPESYL